MLPAPSVAAESDVTRAVRFTRETSGGSSCRSPTRRGRHRAGSAGGVVVVDPDAVRRHPALRTDRGECLHLLHATGDQRIHAFVVGIALPTRRATLRPSCPQLLFAPTLLIRGG